MTFVDDNGNQLNFDGSFAITKRSISLFDGKVAGDTSINFQVDNNSVNRKVLGYNGPQMLNQIAATKQPFNRMRNGNIIDRGYIVIQDEYEDVLDCYYVSGNSNWIQALNIPINQLDYTGVLSLRNYTMQMNDVSINATTGRTYGVIFPIADWYANYRRGKMINQAASFPNSVWLGFPSGASYTDSNGSAFDYPILDFYPCIFISSLIDEITAQTGIKIAGSLLQDQLFKILIMPPFNGLITKTNLFNPVVLQGSSQVFGAAGKYTSYTEITDNDNLFSSGTFTAQKTCNLKCTITIVATSGAVNLTIYKNNIALSPSYTTASTYTIIVYIPVHITDQVELRVTGAVTITINWNIEEYDKVAYNSYFDPSNFLPSLKCVDLIKFLINYFGCAASFNDFSNTLSLNIIEKFKREDAQDWSNYYLSHRSEYTVNTSRHNYFNFKTNNSDQLIVNYNSKNILGYGSGDVQTNNTLTDNKVVVTHPIPACSFGLTKDNTYLTRVPLLELQDSGEPIPFTAIAYNATSGESNFTIASSTFIGTQWVRIISTLGTDYGIYFISSSGIGTYSCYFPFYGTDTGFWIKQQVKYNNVGPMIISNKTVNVWDLYPGYLNWYSFEGGLTSSHDYAIFSKFRTGLGALDQCKLNLSIDNPNIVGYEDSTIKEQYMNKIQNFFKNPPIRAQMLLPEAIYQSYLFDKFVFLKTKDLTGYFFVENIANYQDGNTPVEVNLYML